MQNISKEYQMYLHNLEKIIWKHLQLIKFAKKIQIYNSNIISVKEQTIGKVNI